MDHVDRIKAQWGKERPDLDVSAMGVVGRVSRLSQRFGQEMERTFRAHGLNGPSFDVLATLRRSGPPFALSPGDLMASAMVASGTMTNRIDRLEQAGLIERAANPDDGRSVLIGLTARGREVIDAAVKDHAATQARLLAGLSAMEFAQIEDALRKLLAAAEGG